MIDAAGITWRAGRATLLDDVCVEAGEGELVAIVGPNGAGKSSLLAVLAGDVRPDRGSVTIAGAALRGLRPAALARLRAVLPQKVTLAFPFTVAQVVEMGQYGRPYDERTQREVMDATEVAHLAHRAFPTLSGGEQARVSLARVLAQGAPVLLLDEPTAPLDLRHQEQVMGLVRQRARLGDTVVVVLHDLNLAAAYADRIVVMREGRVAADGAPGDVLDAGLLSEVYACPIEVRDNLVLPVRHCDFFPEVRLPLGGPSRTSSSAPAG
ncbi:heme ABC transporter ATP-binding protein [Nonomuraea soli]